MSGLKTRFGQPFLQPKRLGTKANDMSQAGLQILQLELDNLHAERAQRERKLDMLLGRLRKACIELDEDDSAAAAAAHPSLQHHRSVILLMQASCGRSCTSLVRGFCAAQSSCVALLNLLQVVAPASDV